jgi:hypothetical protein
LALIAPPPIGIALDTSAINFYCEHGSFSLIGYRSGGPLMETLLKATRKLVAAQGSFSLTGQDATLSEAAPSTIYAPPPIGILLETPVGYVTGERGLFTVNGQAATFHRGVALSCAPGAYAFSGAPSFSDFEHDADKGAFAVNGQAAGMLKTWNNLSCAHGTFSLSGQQAGLTYEQPGAKRLDAHHGTYNLSGQDATMDRRPYRLTCDYGTFTFTGQAAGLSSSGDVWDAVTPSDGTWTEVTPESTTWAEAA